MLVVCRTLSKTVWYFYAAHHFCNIIKGFLFGLTPALPAYDAASLILYRLSIVQGKLIDLAPFSLALMTCLPAEWFVKVFPSFTNSCILLF